jgi:parvulin-like peptidyl-prolyl isomerase
MKRSAKNWKTVFGFYENGTPTAVPTIAYKPTSTYSPTQLALLAPVASPTATATEEVPVAQDNEVMSTESPIDDSLIEDSTATPTATEVLPTNTPTEEPSATPVPPTATPFTREGYENLYATSVANLTSNTRYNETDFREYVRSLLFQQKMYDYVVKDLTPDQEMVWVRHMLVTTEEEALTILDKLDNGEDFASLAAEFSTDTANSFNGGDLGWTYQGQMVSEFEKAAWSLKIGEISEPVQTQYGFHIIQVLGREIRPMDENTFSGYKNTIFRTMSMN